MAIAVDTVASAPPRGRRWITDWRPEDRAFWDSTGARIARRNLVVSILCEHIGFSVWTLWSVLVLFLGPAYHVDPAGKFLLTAVPALVGSVMRLPYTFAVARFGGRNWTVVSAALLLVPSVGVALLLRPGVSYTTLVVLAAMAGRVERIDADNCVVIRIVVDPNHRLANANGNGERSEAVLIRHNDLPGRRYARIAIGVLGLCARYRQTGKEG